MESPLELVEGFVGSIEVAVPWAALLTDHCTVRVSGLQLTLQPRRGPGEGRAGWGQASGEGQGVQDLTEPACLETLFLPTAPGAADSQSWASCMTTSLQLAQECLRDGLPEPSEPPQPLEGLEMFAQTIETGEQAPPGRPVPCPSMAHRTRAPDSGMATWCPHGKFCLPFAAPLDLRPLPDSSVLRRIKVTFLDTVVRVEHSPGDGERGVAVEVRVQR